MKHRLVLSAAILVATAGWAVAQPGSGPVAAACVDDIAKFCAEESHGNRGVRTCLESHRDKVSDACRTALDTTGPGRGQGRQNIAPAN